MEISCEENINKSTSSNVNEDVAKKKQVIPEQKQKPKKKLLFKLIIIISILIIISIITALMILFKRKEKFNVYYFNRPSIPESINITEFNNLLAEKKNNSITMLYSLQKKKRISLIQP